MEVIKYTLALISVATLVGCQGNNPFSRESNPYPKALQNYTPERSTLIDEQLLKIKTFHVDAEGEFENTRLLQFVAGEAASYPIKARSDMGDKNFSLVAHNLPTDSGATFIKSTTEENTWILTWQPPIDFIAAGQNGKNLDIQIEFVPEDKQVHAVFEKKIDFRLSVRHSDQQIVVSSSSVDSIEEAQSTDNNIEFELTVVDPASSASKEPKINIVLLEQTTEGLPANFSLARNGSAKFEGSGKWTIPMVIDLSLIQKKFQSLNEENVRVMFAIEATSRVTNDASPIWSKSLNVQFKKESTNE